MYSPENEGPDKRAASESLLSLLKFDQQPKTILSLPAGHWLTEQEMIRRFPTTPFTFLGVEYNPSTHAAATRKAAQLSRSTSAQFTMLPCADLLDVLQSTDQHFDLVYADWVGTLALNKMEQLRTVCERRLIKDNGYLAWTCSLERGRSTVRDMLPSGREWAGFIHDLRLPRRPRRSKRPLHDIRRNLKVSGTPVWLQQNFGHLLPLTPVCAVAYFGGSDDPDQVKRCTEVTSLMQHVVP